jgi:hypothetical protein
MARPVPKETKPKVCALLECSQEFNRKLTVPGVRLKPESIPHYENREYCSKQCAMKARRVIPKPKNCENTLCGKEFIKRNTHWYAQRFCSVACKDIAARADPTLPGKERRAARDKARRENGRKVSLVKSKKKQKALRQKYVAFKRNEPKPEHVFPEGPRTEVWRPASWKK